MNIFICTYSLLQKPVSPNECSHADMNMWLTDFISALIGDSIQLDIPTITVHHVEEDIKQIAGNKATGLDGIGITRHFRSSPEA